MNGRGGTLASKYFTLMSPYTLCRKGSREGLSITGCWAGVDGGGGEWSWGGEYGGGW